MAFSMIAALGLVVSLRFLLGSPLVTVSHLVHDMT